MVRHTFVFYHFGTLCIKGLIFFLGYKFHGSFNFVVYLFGGEINTYMQVRERERDCSSALSSFYNVRSSHRISSIKSDVFENFAKLTGKQLCWSLFFNKVAGLQIVTLL